MTYVQKERKQKTGQIHFQLEFNIHKAQSIYDLFATVFPGPCHCRYSTDIVENKWIVQSQRSAKEAKETKPTRVDFIADSFNNCSAL